MSQGNAGFATKGQKMAKSGKGGKMGGHDALISEKSKSMGAKKMPVYTNGAIATQKVC